MSATLDFKNIIPVSQVTLDDVAIMRSLLASGDRGGAYMHYYKLTGSKQALIQAQITTYSGTFGGAALYGNYLAKTDDMLSGKGNYNLTLDKFSADIVLANINAIQSDIERGGTGVLNDETLQSVDKQVWIDYGMGHLFPGNLQMPGDDYLNVFTSGFWNGATAGAEGYSLGKYVSEFDTANYEIIGLHDIDSPVVEACWIDWL